MEALVILTPKIQHSVRFVSHLVLFTACSERAEVNVTFLRRDVTLLKPSHKDFPGFQTCLDNFQAVSDSQGRKIQTAECRSWLIKASLLQWIIYTEQEWKSELLPLHCDVQIAISAVIKLEEKRGLYDKRILLSCAFWTETLSWF